MSDMADGSVRVTIRDLHALLLEQSARLTDLTLEVRLANQRAADRDAMQADHETRIRGLERKVWALPSLAGLVSLTGLGISLINVIR